jgi:hypothetical protein
MGQNIFSSISWSRFQKHLQCFEIKLMSIGIRKGADLIFSAQPEKF